MRKLSVLLLCLALSSALADAQTRPRRTQPRARKPVPQKPAAPQVPPADLVIVGGKVFVGVGQPPAQAVAIRADRIETVGTDESVRKLVGPRTRVIDARGAVVVPGFNDAHAHPAARPEGVQLDTGPMPPDPAFKEILKLIADAVAKAPAGTWIFGSIGGRVIDDAEATRFGLDEVSKEHPVLLRAWTGHGTFFNTAAMHVLGLSETEPDPPGGFFTRLRKGGSDRTLSGFAHEYAEYRIDRKLSEMAGDERIVEAFRRFADECLAAGVTSAQAMMVSHDADRVAPLLRDANLSIRLRLVRVPLQDPAAWQPPAGTDPPAPGTALAVWGTKWIVDGTPVERLGYIRQPYADQSRWKGQPNFRDAALRAMFEKALEKREQVMLHAFGDGAIEQVFNTMTAAGSPLRWQSRRARIEHGDLLVADLVPRAKNLGIVLVQNPSHLTLRDLFARRLGAGRLNVASPLKSLVAAGIPVAFGSDGPLSPGLNLMFATTHPINPPEALSREEAVHAYTFGSAYAEFAETQKGSIAPGMLADLAVLTQDVFTVPADALPATAAQVTIVGGQVVHEKP